MIVKRIFCWGSKSGVGWPDWPLRDTLYQHFFSATNTLIYSITLFMACLYCPISRQAFLVNHLTTFVYLKMYNKLNRGWFFILYENNAHSGVGRSGSGYINCRQVHSVDVSCYLKSAIFSRWKSIFCLVWNIAYMYTCIYMYVLSITAIDNNGSLSVTNVLFLLCQLNCYLY